MASSSQFQKAHADAVRAVSTFLPSLGPNPPAPPPPPPHPMAKGNIMHEMTHAAAMARHVETASGKIAIGLPPDPAQPPPPEETFGNVLDVVHTGALRAAIAAHPEEERSRLISEAQDSAVKWIMSHNGKVVVHGKVMIAHDLKGAQSLAAKIVNEEVEGHDQESRDALEATIPNGGTADKAGTRRPPAVRTGQPEKPQGSTRGGGSQSNTPTDNPVDNSGNGRAAPSGDTGALRETPQTTGELPGPVGSIDPDSNRVITHSTDDLDQAQEAATAAAPELEGKLQDVADSVPGISVHGVRPKKDKDRAQRKVEADDKPVNTHSDLLAGRLVADSPEAKEAAVAALKGSAPIIDEEDSFQQGDPDYGFRSHDLQVALGQGDTSAEVQIVPKEVSDVDEETHPTYEKGRDAEADGDTETAEKAKAENRATHDEAMKKFNERNGVDDRSAKLRELLKQAGYDVTGDPVRIGGHAFLPIRESVE